MDLHLKKLPFNVSSTGQKSSKRRLRGKIQNAVPKNISAMTAIISRLDLTQIFCDVDDFYQYFQRNRENQPQLPSDDRQKPCLSRLGVSEVMTIVIAFHGSGYKTFKEFYLKQVLPYWQREFPNLSSYNRFVELIPGSLMLLTCFLNTRMGKMTGIALIDSTPIEVCHPCRANSHKVWFFRTYSAKLIG